MTTQIAILMILLQILIGCGEHLDVCKHGQLSSVMHERPLYRTPRESDQVLIASVAKEAEIVKGDQIIAPRIMENDKTTLKIPCKYLYKETDDLDLLYKIGQKLKCGDKIGTDQWTLYCSEDGYVKCGERLPANANRIIDDLKDPDYVESLNETELHNKIIENLIPKSLYQYQGDLDEDGRIKTKLSELQKEELERLLKCKTFNSLGEVMSVDKDGYIRETDIVICEEDSITSSIVYSQRKRNRILQSIDIFNYDKMNAGKEEIKKLEEEIKKLEKELEELDNHNLDIYEEGKIGRKISR